jgi:putative phosphoesterase
MFTGLFADTHDHLANIRLAVERFNEAECELVLFAGDLVSTFAVPPLRKLKCPFVGCFGDNEGNKVGLRAGFTMVGQIGEPPVRYTAADGTRFILCHMQRQLRGEPDDWDIALFGHTHKPRVTRDEKGRLLINPGETSGWTFGRPTIALLETATREVQIIDLAPPANEGGALASGKPGTGAERWSIAGKVKHEFGLPGG